MKRLSPSEELSFMAEIKGDPILEHAFQALHAAFAVLQFRSQLLLGLITICLTITGFSGERIAQSSTGASIAVFVGVASVLLAALTLVSGPLHIRWATRYRASSVEETLHRLIERRDLRTRLYHLATALLLLGLMAYVTSLALFLLNS